MKLEAFEMYPVSDGRFRLDGGAMFGVVPKVIWEKCCAADELNRIPLNLTCLLIRAQGKNILVDTGLGSKEDDKFQRMFAVERTPTLLDSLKRLGLGREDIHVVINTHLHFDHAGGNTMKEEDGTIAPTDEEQQRLDIGIADGSLKLQPIITETDQSSSWTSRRRNATTTAFSRSL
mgnify:CR=1 FL=1